MPDVMRPVESSMVHSVLYTQGTLVVKFNSGGVYLYERVPRAKFDAMMKASSLGGYFAANIRNGHTFVKIA